LNNPLIARRILVVEDELIVSWLLEDMLADLGCVVIGPVANVAQALDLIENLDIDAAVLDVCLNGEFSYPVADAMMARGLPFIFATGYDKGRLLPDYRACVVLQKPYQAADLRGALLAVVPREGLDSDDEVTAAPSL
jgi:DNA-binding NtrC family response regulator